MASYKIGILGYDVEVTDLDEGVACDVTRGPYHGSLAILQATGCLYTDEGQPHEVDVRVIDRLVAYAERHGW